jgi:hypothetical protein
MDWTCGTHWRSEYKIVIGKPEGKRPYGRSRRGWEERDNRDN